MKKRKPIEMTYDEGVTAGDKDAPGLAASLKAPGKLRITTWVDEDVVDRLKDLAGARGYQTLLNKILREHVLNEEKESTNSLLAQVIAAIEANLVPQIESRIEKKWTKWTKDFLDGSKPERKAPSKKRAHSSR